MTLLAVSNSDCDLRVSVMVDCPLFSARPVIVLVLVEIVLDLRQAFRQHALGRAGCVEHHRLFQVLQVHGFLFFLSGKNGALVQVAGWRRDASSRFAGSEILCLPRQLRCVLCTLAVQKPKSPMDRLWAKKKAPRDGAPSSKNRLCAEAGLLFELLLHLGHGGSLLEKSTRRTDLDTLATGSTALGLALVAK